MIKFYEMVKLILTAKNNHFLLVDFKTYRKFGFLIQILIRLNKNYIPCKVYRKKYKSFKSIVIIALKWNGKNVKRRTNGYAKDYIIANRKYNCPYCECILSNENATSDHIVPISAGGNNCRVNLIVCCESCNSERGDKDFYYYLRKKNKKYTKVKYPFL